MLFPVYGEEDVNNPGTNMRVHRQFEFKLLKELKEASVNFGSSTALAPI